jgi:hypothetical protein
VNPIGAKPSGFDGKTTSGDTGNALASKRSNPNRFAATPSAYWSVVVNQKTTDQLSGVTIAIAFVAALSLLDIAGPFFGNTVARTSLGL